MGCKTKAFDPSDSDVRSTERPALQDPEAGRWGDTSALQSFPRAEASCGW